MEKNYFVIRVAYGIMSIRKTFEDKNDAEIYATLSAKGEDEQVKYYVTETIAIK